ncbi:uncharacterized protein LOC110445400 [Mizuhopecten yessoensis]|uniref:uncharacterized protein LOC110445400 n=1 Tax=Mizuhopecten yessoensis TaxID=6573 RepID=UPI000B45EF9B|nr:uncharacterized protein LOC110445400 [Mizuhopecten yessoensis]
MPIMQCSPFFLMFGREPRLPIDLAFGLERGNSHESLPVYIKELRDRMKESFRIASEAAKNAQHRQKVNYDKKVRGATVQPGDRVLVKILAFEGKHKLSDRWEEDVYIVTRHPNEGIPVFEVQKENKSGRKRILHRNHLMPIGSITGKRLDKVDGTPVKDRPVPAPKRKKITERSLETSRQEDESEEESEDESDYQVTHVVHRDEVEDDASSASFGDLASEEDSRESKTPVDSIVVEDEPTEDLDDDGTTNPESDDDHVEQVTVPEEPRRSGRRRQQPAWMSSDTYVMATQGVPEWMQNIKRFILNRIREPVFVIASIP